MQSTSAKAASAAISKAVLEHNLSCAREAVQMAANAKDATSAIAAAATVVDAVERIMCSGVSRSAGIETLQRAAAASTTAEELAEIVFTAKLFAAITYAAAMEAISATSAFSATADTAAISESASSMRKRKGYTRLE